MPEAETINTLWDFFAYADESEMRLTAAALVDQEADRQLLLGQLELFREHIARQRLEG